MTLQPALPLSRIPGRRSNPLATAHVPRPPLSLCPVRFLSARETPYSLASPATHNTSPPPTIPTAEREHASGASSAEPHQAHRLDNARVRHNQQRPAAAAQQGCGECARDRGPPEMAPRAVVFETALTVRRLSLPPTTRSSFCLS